MNRVGILGGTFDPIHLGHLVPAEYAFDYLRLDRLLLVPSATPVHRPLHAPASGEHRARMCRLAAASIPGFSVSEIEVARAEPSYTVLTLRYFADSLPPGTELVLLVGEDNLPLLHTWRQAREILALATIAVMPRPVAEPVDLGPLAAALGNETARQLAAGLVPAPRIPISATEIRERVRTGQSIAGLVPASIARYIAEAGLYTGPCPCQPPPQPHA